MSKTEMETTAELVVLRFFTHYLNEVFPEQLEQMITAHNNDVNAHTRQIKDAVKAESTRLKLWAYGLIFAGGVGGGVGVSRLIASLG